MSDPVKDTQKRARRSQSEINAIRQRAKDLSINNWQKGKIADLERMIAKHSEEALKEAESAPVEYQADFVIDGVSPSDESLFDSLGINYRKVLDGLAVKYGFTKFQYMGKFNAFRCYIENNHVDWADINDISRLSGGQDVMNILSKYSKSPKPVIKMKWRV